MLKRFLKALGRGESSSADLESTLGETLLARLREEFAESGMPDGRSPEIATAELLVERIENAPDEVDVEARRLYGRSLLPLILDNDRLPPSLQLNEDDLERPRALLRSFFFRSGNMQEQASRLLKFIERRFEEKQFSQAEILLELFDSEPSTQRHNESNLFYEAMHWRLKAQRRQQLPTDARRQWEELSAADPAASSTLPSILAFLGSEAGIVFHVQEQNAEELKAWDEVLPQSTPPETRKAFLSRVPPRRWRPLKTDSEPFIKLLLDSTDDARLREHLIALTRLAFFIARTPGRNGFEPLLVRWVRWTGDTFDTISTRILPQIYHDAMDEHRRLGQVFEEAVDAHFSKPLPPGLSCSDEDVRKAVVATTRALANLTIADVPEGDYDLAGLVYDHLLGFTEQADPSLVRMRRLL